MHERGLPHSRRPDEKNARRPGCREDGEQSLDEVIAAIDHAQWMRTLRGQLLPVGLEDAALVIVLGGLGGSGLTLGHFELEHLELRVSGLVGCEKACGTRVLCELSRFADDEGVDLRAILDHSA